MNQRALNHARLVRDQLSGLAPVAESRGPQHGLTPEAKEENVCKAIAEGLFMNCAERQPDGSYRIVSLLKRFYKYI